MNWRLVLPLSHGLSLKKLCGWRLMTIHLMIDPFLCGPIKVKHYLLLLERPKRFLRLNDPPTHMHKHICGVGMDFMIQQFMGPQVDLHWFICSASFCVALTKNKIKIEHLSCMHLMYVLTTQASGKSFISVTWCIYLKRNRCRFLNNKKCKSFYFIVKVTCPQGNAHYTRLHFYYGRRKFDVGSAKT